MALAISIALFAFLLAAITFYGYRRYARPGRIAEQVGPAVVVTAGPYTMQAPGGRSYLVRVVEFIGEKVPVSPQDATETQRYLVAAGIRSESAVAVYYGSKVLGCVLLGVAALLLRPYMPDNTILRNVFQVAAVAAGYFLPNFVLEKLVDRRHEELRLSLPDALDMMVVAVEAGLGLDQAINSVSRELAITHKALSEEFGLMTLEMRAGKRRVEALRNLADRTGEPEFRKLVAVLIQTDRFGTSVAESLRTHSDFMRVRRRQEAEERAGKVGVKLIFPIFFCILPAMFVVAAGPALLAIVKQLRPLMRSIGH